MSRYPPPRGKKPGKASPHYQPISPRNDRRLTGYLDDDPYESYDQQTLEQHLSSLTPEAYERYVSALTTSSRTGRPFKHDARAAARQDDERGRYNRFPAPGPRSSATGQSRSREEYQQYGGGNDYHTYYGYGNNGQGSGHGIQSRDYGHLNDDEGYGPGIRSRDYGHLNDDEGYGPGGNDRHGQHHGGTSHRQDKRPTHEPSTSQHPRHHHSGRSGGQRGHASDEQMLQDQMLAMSLQQQEDEYSSAFVSGGPSPRYLEGPRSQALIGYEHGEQSTSALVPYDGGRRHKHAGVADPQLAHYETISPKTRDHYGGRSKSSSREIAACGVCLEEFPVAELYKLCPQSKCSRFCADCTKDYFKSAMKSMPKKPLLCCKESVSIDPVAHLFRPRTVEEYRMMRLEFETVDKVYCSHKKCSAFIPPQSINGRDATCQQCGRQTCTLCKTASHGAKLCRSNPDDEKVKELGHRKGWQPCPQCSTMTIKKAGCDHIICTICGTHWCYKCGSKDCDTQQCVRNVGDRLLHSTIRMTVNR